MHVTKLAHGCSAAVISLLHMLWTHVPHAELEADCTKALQLVPPSPDEEELKHLTSARDSTPRAMTLRHVDFMQASTGAFADRVTPQGGGGGGVRQVPPAQKVPGPQTVVQLPQCWLLSSVSVSQPLALLPSQLAQFAMQFSWQVPVEQSGLPLSPPSTSVKTPQAFPQPPQFAFVVSEVSQSAAGNCALQCANPVAQAVPQVPLHVGT
jgi:hypothetical protein